MDCEKVGDERLQAEKMDVLYGEAEGEVRARVEAHLRDCPACREEMQALRRLRSSLAAWELPSRRAAPRGVVLPRWLAVAAALVLGISLAAAAGGCLSLRRSLAAQQARTAALERALAGRDVDNQGAAGQAALLARVDARIEERLRASEARQAQAVEARFASWNARLDAQRRIDLARVAEGLSYLDGRHGEQLARTNELMGYVLEQAAQNR